MVKRKNIEVVHVLFNFLSVYDTQKYGIIQILVISHLCNVLQFKEEEAYRRLYNL